MSCCTPANVHFKKLPMISNTLHTPSTTIKKGWDVLFKSFKCIHIEFILLESYNLKH